jgi:P4 family phage/plasmid primase-like protien
MNINTKENIYRIEKLIQEYYKINKNNKDYFMTLPLKDDGKKNFYGKQNNLTLNNFIELQDNGETTIYDEKKNKQTIYKTVVEIINADAYELRNRLSSFNIIVIDVDGIKKNGDCTYEEFFSNNKIPKWIKDKNLPYTLSRNKVLPHFYIIVNDFDDIKFVNNIYTDCFKDFKGDILFNHSWEIKWSILYNYNERLPEVSWNDIYNSFNTTTKKNFSNFIKYDETNNIDTTITNDTIKLYSIDDTISMISELTDFSNNFQSKEKNNDINYEQLEYYLMNISTKKCDDYNTWIKICWAIYNIGIFNKWRNIDIFNLIHKFSSKSSKYDKNEVDKIFEKIEYKSDGVGLGTIIYFFEEDNQDYSNLNKLINNTQTDYVLDYDIAVYIKNKFGDIFVCENIEKNSWYRFEKNRWIYDEGCYTLSKKISEDIPIHIERIIEKYKNQLNNTENKDKIKSITDKIKKAKKMLEKCKNSTGKKTLLTELGNLYKKEKFIDNLDINPYLLCCSNGVIDFRNNEFREGMPDDMCSLSTGYDYISLEYILNNKELKEEYDKLIVFFEQIFVIDGIRDYIFEHLASVLLGICKEQDFNYYIGKGSNGKTILVKLMSIVMGEYYSSAPSALICSKKVDIGTCSGEIALLRGKRYVVMQEPTKGEKINEGILKELTGENDIMCNPKNKTPFQFTPMFHLIICANFTLDITSNDDGTWRRIKVVDFLSKFSNNNDKDSIFEFKKDINIIEKFSIWKKILLAILVEKCYKLKGVVNENLYIKNASLKYREEQDRIGQFIKYHLEITKNKNDIIDINELSDLFKKWYELKFKYKIGNKTLLDRLEDEYFINNINNNIIGLKLKNINNNIENKTDEDIFIEEFEKKFEIKKGDDREKYYIKSVRLNEWAIENRLSIYTSKSINKLLLEKYGIDNKDEKMYKYKKINGKSISCWIGIKEKDL